MNSNRLNEINAEHISKYNDYNYIFSNKIDEKIDEIYTDFAKTDDWYYDVDDYLKISKYNRSLTQVSFKHWNKQEYVRFNIRQTGKGAGTIEMKFTKARSVPMEQGASYLDDIALAVLDILKRNIIKVRKMKNNINNTTRREKEAVGQAVARVYEEKTGQSAKPGSGPANTIRKFLGAQPPKKHNPSLINREHKHFRDDFLGGTRKTRRVRK